LGQFSLFYVFQGFHVMVLVQFNRLHVLCLERSSDRGFTGGEVKWSWFSGDTRSKWPTLTPPSENKQKTATNLFTKYRNQGSRESDNLTPSQQRDSALQLQDWLGSRRTPPEAAQWVQSGLTGTSHWSFVLSKFT
jgi:hypothetical protein